MSEASFVIKNNLEIDVKVKCMEECLTQLAERLEHLLRMLIGSLRIQKI